MWTPPTIIVQDDEKIAGDKQTLTSCSGEQDTCSRETPKGASATQNEEPNPSNLISVTI